MHYFDLARFIDAQSPIIDQVVAELRAGCKRTHWMWYIFPQLQGLGRSAMARRYAITSLAEARAYAAQPILGPRLETCTQIVNELSKRAIESIFGTPDDLKFHASMTLFSNAVDSPCYREALTKYFHSNPHVRTLELVGAT